MADDGSQTRYVGDGAYTCGRDKDGPYIEAKFSNPARALGAYNYLKQSHVLGKEDVARRQGSHIVHITGEKAVEDFRDHTLEKGWYDITAQLDRTWDKLRLQKATVTPAPPDTPMPDSGVRVAQPAKQVLPSNRRFVESLTANGDILRRLVEVGPRSHEKEPVEPKRPLEESAVRQIGFGFGEDETPAKPGGRRGR